MRVVAFIWIGLLAFLSVAPFRLKLFTRSNGPFHDAGHFVVFCVTGFLWGWNASKPGSWAMRAMAGAGIAVVLESLEKFIYRNSFEWHDVFIDVLGLAAGLLIVAAVHSYGRPATGQK